MNREGAETFLRLLAETELRGPMTPAMTMPRTADAPAGSACRLMVTAAQALTAVQALDPETAERILTDFDLAAVVRPGHPQPAPAGPARTPRPWPGQLRFTIPRIYRAPPAAGTASSAPPGPGWTERFVPVGVSVPFGDDEFAGELQLISYAHVASGAVFAMTWSIGHAAAPYTAVRAHPGVLTWRFTITDDRGQHYDLDATGSSGPASTDFIWLRPHPPPDIRWLEFSSPGTSPVRVELAATAGPEPQVSEAYLSAGEQLLIMIAERLMALAADYPQDQRAQPASTSRSAPAAPWTPTARPAPAPRGALDATAAGLGTIIAALEVAEVLSLLSPVPGWLATLCASLNISGHGVTAPPARDLPEPWLSLLAHYQRRKPDTGSVHDGFAAMTVALPELDGIRLVLLGLHTSGGFTSLPALASGLNLDARAGPGGVETHLPLSVWIRDSGGRWHVVRSSGWHRAGPEYALQLWLVPPLPRSATWIEVLATGRSAQVRVRLTLRWGLLAVTNMPNDPWYSGLASCQTMVPCSQGMHTVRWEAGALVLPTHADAEAELVLAALGGEKAGCIELAETWGRHTDDLSVLAIGPRGVSDGINVSWDDVKQAVEAGQRGSPARRGPMRPAGWQGSASTAARQQQAQQEMEQSERRRTDLLSLLALGYGFQVRLAGQVVAAHADRLDERARPALTAAITGRLALVAEQWLGIDPGQVEVTLHTGPGWGATDLTGRGEERRLRVSLPAWWLARVWACGLPLIAGHLVVAVERAGWPDARVLAVHAPGAEPVPLDVHAREAAPGGRADAGDAPHWEM